jgi:hypothetical protein
MSECPEPAPYFDYYEIRCCVDTGEETYSFTGEVWCQMRECYIGTPKAALAEAQEYFDPLRHKSLFWTLYGRWNNGLAQAIGDFKTFEATYKVMQGILMPMREAINLMDSETGSGGIKTLNDAQCLLEDICNQSSSEERL